MKTLTTLMLAGLCIASPYSLAAGERGREVALASYDRLGLIAATGFPLQIEFLAAQGWQTYGELELGFGLGDTLALGVDVSAGLLFGLAQGLSGYASLGPALSLGADARFGLGVEIGLNIDINQRALFIEAGRHPAATYLAVGIRF